MKTPAIGIDLGTTYSCVAVFESGRAEVISNSQGNRITPSIVAFNDFGRLVGDGAKNQLSVNPENTILDVKRLMGRKFEDPQVTEDRKLWPFKVVELYGNPKVEVIYRGGKKQFTPQEISSMILARMRQTAEVYLGKSITEAVITVPAYFNDLQRQATEIAGISAGLNVLKIINEPTAVGLAYGLNKKFSSLRNVLIYDLGGGTFDVSLLEIKNQSFNVKATSSDSHLGGKDFDNRLVSYFAAEFKNKHKLDLTSSPKAIARLRLACEGAKRTLSSHVNASINIDSLYYGIDFCSSISRAKFEDLCLDLFESTLDPTTKVLKASYTSKSEVDEIILVGGSTRIPKIYNLVKDYFNGKEPILGINPDEVVAKGAAIQAAMLTTKPSDLIKDTLITDVTQTSLGIKMAGSHIDNIIPSNTQISFNIMDKYSINILPSLLEGQAKIEVAFETDNSGGLQVSFKGPVNNHIQSISISPNKNKLMAKEMTEPTKETKRYRITEKARIDQIKARQKFEAYLYYVKGIIYYSEFNLKILSNEIATVKEVVNRAFDWLNENQSASAGRFIGYLYDVELCAKPLVKTYLKSTGRKKYTLDLKSLDSIVIFLILFFYIALLIYIAVLFDVYNRKKLSRFFFF